MPKIVSIVYKLDSGTRIEYKPDFSEVSEDAMSVIIKLIDGEDLEAIVSKFL